MAEQRHSGEAWRRAAPVVFRARNNGCGDVLGAGSAGSSRGPSHGAVLSNVWSQRARRAVVVPPVAGARVLLKLLQHLLIWLAASAAIVVGASWGYVVGFASHRAGPQLLAWTIASVTVIFA